MTFPKKVAYNVGNGMIVETIAGQEELDELDRWVQMNHGDMVVE